MAVKFKYFPDFPAGADLTSDPYSYCGRAPALPAIRLGFGTGANGSICADCLAKGMATVNVPSWVQRDLESGVDRTHPDWSEQQRSRYVSERVNELARTPPVPWLQNNEWPVCGDDFAEYNDEVARELLLQQHETVAEAKSALRGILKDAMPNWEQSDNDVDMEWEELGNYLAIFLFRCQDGKPVYIVQTA